MGFLDKAKKQAQSAADKAKEQAGVAAALAKEATTKAATRIEDTGLVDKVASTVDQQTKGKYSDKIAKAAEAAKGSVGKLTPGESVVDMEYSTEFGSEPTETAAEAAEVFEQE